ncbi:hypothetical protein FRC0141_02019 [Corynebacterium diphtheriae]|nr:hypothetical protein FRC0114_01913 [Corynebacterium diphtheriae]CAB0759371.1 hypothetical protein FRC0150_01961 [Corynebacterium diphtheriae]CAB0761052.1 hypothetical protein FRC0141_02019 [Corynebacterium diphtheriae]
MFKRSLVAVTVVAVVSGTVVAPANAVTVTVNNDMCTFNLTDEEARLLSLGKTVTANKQLATLLKTQYGEKQLPTLRMKIAEDEKKLAELGLDAAEREKLTSELNEKRKQLTVYQNFSDALDACIEGRNYNSKRPSDPNVPGPNVPGPNVPGPNVPDGKRALPSINGAVIGAIVAVLSILAAALPAIKSMLRALLP